MYQIQAAAEIERRKREQQKLLINEQLEKYKIAEQYKQSMLKFVLYTKPDYIINWHHKLICELLDKFIAGEISRLMIFIPPQHGKSELVSRRFPAYQLGLDPKVKIIGASYSADLSKSFNKDSQRIIKDNSYEELFWHNAQHKKWRPIEKAEMFETGHGGFYKSVGVGGSLTGFPADVGIIDDPVKGPEEAYSLTQREKLWNWYNNVFLTRMDNYSKQLVTLTRWHEDDLAGRILKSEEDKWKVVSLPGINEKGPSDIDPREIGEAIWENKHSAERLLDIKKKSPRTFVSLIQQNPAPEEGDIIKKAWFKYFTANEELLKLPKHFFSDTAYGKEESDNSATMSYSIHDNDLYVWDIWKVNLSFPDFKKSYISYIETHGYTSSSKCEFEPKATGISIVQELKTMHLSNGDKINVIEGKAPKDSKITRTMTCSSIIESGRVHLLKGSGFIQEFLLECAMFPNGQNDDQVDALISVILKYLYKNEPRIGWL